MRVSGEIEADFENATCRIEAAPQGFAPTVTHTVIFAAAAMTSRTTGRARQTRASDAALIHNKENAKVTGEKTKGKAKSRAASKKVYCNCRKPDDGSPMILCAHCKEWCVFCVPFTDSRRFTSFTLGTTFDAFP